MALGSHAATTQSHAALAEIRDTLLETYAANDAMNQLILSELDRVRGAPSRRADKRPGPNNRGHLRAPAQHAAEMAEAFRAASEAASCARSAPLHDEAGCRRAQEKRRAVPGDVDGCAFGSAEAAGGKIFARRLGARLAGGRDDVRVHVRARGAPSRANFDDGAPTRLPGAQGDVRNLAMGKAVEGGGAKDAAAVSAVAADHDGHFGEAVFAVAADFGAGDGDFHFEVAGRSAA